MELQRLGQYGNIIPFSITRLAPKVLTSAKCQLGRILVAQNSPDTESNWNVLKSFQGLPSQPSFSLPTFQGFQPSGVFCNKKKLVFFVLFGIFCLGGLGYSGWYKIIWHLSKRILCKMCYKCYSSNHVLTSHMCVSGALKGYCHQETRSEGFLKVFYVLLQ